MGGSPAGGGMELSGEMWGRGRGCSARELRRRLQPRLRCMWWLGDSCCGLDWGVLVCTYDAIEQQVALGHADVLFLLGVYGYVARGASFEKQ